MKVIHLMTSPAGGAARVGINMHCGLREQSVSSEVLYLNADALGKDERIFEVPRDPISTLSRGIRRAIHRAEFRPYRKWLRKSGQPRWERFSSDRVGWGEPLARAVSGFDIVHLHWVSDFVDLKPFFEALPDHVRVVWTLHDMWAFTGGCHFPEGCERYRDGCGACPQWGSRLEEDFSRQSLRRRTLAYAGLGDQRLRIITPSRWMAEQAARSSLFRDRKIDVVANGLDLGGFRPVERIEARRQLGLGDDAFVALFLADSGGNRRKGLAVLEKALEGWPASGHRVLLVVGGADPKPIPGWNVVPLGYVTGSERLSSLYSAADVFVHPALEDNLPSTVLESLACGTPVAAFRIGGLPELVTGEDFGALADPATSGTMRELLADAQRWKSDPVRRAACRHHAKAFSIRAMVDRYLEIYRSFG